MPTIDVSFVVEDAMFADDFNVLRRAEVVNIHGRTEVTETPFRDQVGAVYPTGPNTLTRDPDQEFSTKTITVVTKFRLQMDSPGYKPDLVEWPKGSGDHYIVNFLQDYSRYGAGFVQAQCTAINAVVAPPTE